MLLRKRKSHAFERVAKIQKIIIYPVKSLRGVPVETAQVTKLGLKFGRFMDRQWIIAKDDGGFITQRQEPTMALISVDIVDGELRLEAPDKTSVTIKPKTELDATGRKMRCEVFTQEIDCMDCGDEAANFIQKYLNRNDVRIGQFILDYQPRRIFRNKYKFPNRGNVIYQDDSPFNMLSQASVANLNEKLAETDKISYKNFRPNILVSDCSSHDEDNWKEAEIGTAKFQYVEPCTRCIFTTINPETGIMNKYEPLRALRTYRMSDDEFTANRYFDKENLASKRAMKSPRFGCYFTAKILGHLSVGDDIYAIRH